MALRSLVVKLKDLPRRMSAFGAFVPKVHDNPWSSSSARLIDPYKYGSVEEMAQAMPKIRLDLEEHQRRIRIYTRSTVRIGVVSFGSLGYIGKTF